MNILILCEHFAPSSRTASFRAIAWAKHLPNHNINPRFITSTLAANPHVLPQEIDNTSIIRVDCGTTTLSRLRHRFAGSITGRFFGLWDELLDNYAFYNPVKRLAPAASNVIKQYDIDLILVTVPSFALLHLAKSLAKQHQVRWVIDFRDDWITNEEVSGFTRLKYRFEHHLFQSYVKGADCIIAVSDHQQKKLAEATNLPCFLFENGYDHYDNGKYNHNEDDSPVKLSSDCLNIIYTGTLYKTQNLNYLQAIIDGVAADISAQIAIYFIGANTPELVAFAQRNHNVHLIKDRLPKSHIDRLMQQADLALYIAYQKSDGSTIKGVPSSKLYEYIKLKKPVFLAPSDNDIAKRNLQKLGLAVFDDNQNDAIKTITNLAIEKTKLKHIHRVINQTEYEKLSNKAKVAEMAHWLLKRYASSPYPMTKNKGE